MKQAAALLALLLPASTLFAQSSSSDAGSIAGVGLMCGCYLIMGLIGLGLYVFCGLFVTRDAKARQSPNAQLVTILTWIPMTTMIGFIIHLATRPPGNLVACPSCTKKRLAGSATCPHCGAQ